MVISQYNIYLVDLNPTIGHEINKVHPYLVISPNEMNDVVSTVIVAPITSKSHPYPTRLPLRLDGKDGWIVLDQIRTVDSIRLIKNIGKINQKTIREVKKLIQEMLVE